MRPVLGWVLGVTVVASGVLIWRDGPNSVRGASGAGSAEMTDAGTSAQTALLVSPGGTAAGPGNRSSVTVIAPASALPAQLEPLEIEPAKSDPFSIPAPSAPKVAERPLLPPAVVLAPVTPTAPALAWRYWGSMQTPEGRRLLMLARGEQVLPIQPGTKLDDGYTVQAVTESAIRFVYAPLGTVVELTIQTARNNTNE
jgi:hypothetical protein